MNTNIKNILIFSVGFVAGAVTVYYAVKDKFEAQADAEIEEINQYYKEKYCEYKDNCVELPDEIARGLRAGMNMVDDFADSEEYTETMDFKKYENMTRDYAGISKKDDHPREDEEVKAPYVISIDEYNNGPANYDQITIEYYAVDGVLVDENEQVIVDVEPIVGSGNLLMFGMASEDPDMVYVRNEKLRIDYEVVAIDAAYSEMVLGYKPEPEYKEGMRRYDSNEE